jgi:predicted DNA-binding transcriptional regulator AlpA
MSRHTDSNTLPDAPSDVPARQKYKARKSGRTKTGEVPDALIIADDLPDSAGVRQPVVEGLFSCSAATVWRRVKSGLLPQPKRIGRTSIWILGELRQVLAKGGQ